MNNPNRLYSDKTVRPSKAIWDYYSQGVCASGITIGLIMSAISDVIAGYGISRSAKELLYDLDFLSQNGRILKNGKRFLSHEIHARHHTGVAEYHVIINPHTDEAI